MIPTTLNHRAEINRANSQFSTGPKTEEGKQRSSLNALRHGLTSHAVVIPGEDHDIYNAHVQAHYDEHNPQTHSESIIVQLLADLSWRLLRVATLESNLLDQNINYSTFNDQNSRLAAFDKLTKSLANISLHSQRLSRQFESAMIQLRNLQQLRAFPEPGFVFTAPRTTRAAAPRTDRQPAPQNPSPATFTAPASFSPTS